MGLLFAAAALGAVESLYVDERTDYKDGKGLGPAGPYERITANATLTGGRQAFVEVLKPRDPARGNGTLLYLVEAGPSEQAMMEGGFTYLRVKGNDPAAVRDVVSFLRYGGPGFLLTDQRRFLKRFIALASGKNATILGKFVEAGMNKNERGQPVFDVIWLHDSDLKVSSKDDVNIRHTQSAPLEGLLLQLDNSLRGQ
jgi:hypothetical protein